MSIEPNNFAKNFSTYASEHKDLNAVLRYPAAFFYAAGKWCGKAISWIRQCCGTTEDVADVAYRALEENKTTSATDRSEKPLDRKFSTRTPDSTGTIARDAMAGKAETLQKEEVANAKKGEALFEDFLKSIDGIAKDYELYIRVNGNDQLIRYTSERDITLKIADIQAIEIVPKIGSVVPLSGQERTLASIGIIFDDKGFMKLPKDFTYIARAGGHTCIIDIFSQKEKIVTINAKMAPGMGRDTKYCYVAWSPLGESLLAAAERSE